MRPRERRESGKQDLFRSRLDQIIDMNHALVKLARAIDWRFLEERFGAVYSDKPGQPPLPTRLMAGLAILKHSYDLSDEALCDRWIENPYFQYFCGEEFFQHALVFDRSSLTRWRQTVYASSRPISAVSSATSSGASAGGRICGKRSYGRCILPDACSSRSAASVAARCIPCTPRRWSASARARRTGLTSSVSR
jgi:Transposase domain (DUF772)